MCHAQMLLTLEVHNIHTTFRKNMCVTIYYVEWYVGFMGKLRVFDVAVVCPLQIVLSGKTVDVNNGIA